MIKALEVLNEKSDIDYSNQEFILYIFRDDDTNDDVYKVFKKVANVMLIYGKNNNLC